MADPYELIERAEDLADDCRCPCEWGDVVSPAISEGEADAEFALCCIDCQRSTPWRIMRSEADVAGIVSDWRKVCGND